jgi:mono/diheme cytochrome c family protein
MSGLSSRWIVRLNLLAVSSLTLVFSGCGYPGDVPYPKNLKYALRTDLLVEEAPSEQPFEPTPPGEFEKNIGRFESMSGAKVYDPKKLAADDRVQLTQALEDLFGTPNHPKVELAGDKEVEDWADQLLLSEYDLGYGSRLYRRHCLTCHGLDGDGRGSTGPWVSPHPRDYRRGEFKFISTANEVAGRKPRREDLYRTLVKGIDGTSMPAFNLLTDTELNQLISYVIHLSLRGEVEFDTMKGLLAGGKSTLEDGDIVPHTQARLRMFLERWANSTKANEPKPYPYKDGDLEASIKRGYALFTNPEGAASCIKCHEDYGRQVPFRYDLWGTLVRPANLTTGVYRGGRRPIDLYWRIKGGIPPSKMPAADLKIEGGKDEYWDLVNFVQALPYPHMLPEDVRAKIYDEPRARDHTKEHASGR